MKQLLLSALLLLGGGMGLAADDEVKLKNGDRLSGKVVGLLDGKLTVETKHSGKVVVAFAEVASLKTEGPVKVNLKEGQDLEGPVEYADGKLKVGGADADFATVKAFNKPPIAWHGNVNISMKATSGNSKELDIIGTGEVIRKTDWNEVLVRGIYQYGEDAGVLSDRNAYGIGKYSHTITGNLYGYASVELKSDEFADLNAEIISSVGAGFTIVKESWADLSAEAGIAYISNHYDVSQDEGHLGARISATGRIDLPLGFVFKDIFTIYPNFENSQDFTLRNEAMLTTILGAGWNLILGVITEYDRTPLPPDGRHDNTYFAGLGFTF